MRLCKSDILVLSVMQQNALGFCFAFHDFYLLFTETDGENCKLIYKDSPSHASLFQRYKQRK